MTGATGVRSAGAGDREQVLTLARELATSHEVDRDAFASAFDGLVGTPDALLLVVEVDGLVAGYLLAQSRHTFHANGPVVWVEEVMVAGQHRGSGRGRALMRAAEEWAREQGAGYVALATRRAADFYSALGYRASATYFKRMIADG